MNCLTLPVLLALATAPAAVPDTLDLAELHRAALASDPRIQQIELREQATELRLRNLSVERLPRFSVTSELAYQSEVATIPIDVAGAAVPVPPKGRYETALGVDWLLHDSGLGARRAAARAELAADRARVVAELYPLRAQVDDAFFTALLLQDRETEAALVVQDLQARLVEVRTGVVEGAALPGDTAAVRAELLRANQQLAELGADRRAAIAILEGLTGFEIAPGTVLELPDLADAVDEAIASAADPTSPTLAQHPQFDVLEAERARLSEEEGVIRSRSMPEASAFGRFAYGRPGLDQFTNDPREYWLAGVRVQWRPWDWGTRRRERQALQIEQEILETQAESLSDRLRREVELPLESMERLEGVQATDDEIIALREQIVRQAELQFGERVISVTDYVDAVTDLEAARVARLIHRAELARARAAYLTTLGIELPLTP
ncbi:MAG: hypothetical protein GEU90_12570 [Gemmatimonas sp.]|nr:hypothetical protein [Gemmatimonas sp.]